MKKRPHYVLKKESLRGFKRFLKKVDRRNKQDKRRKGWQSFINLLQRNSDLHNRPFIPPSYEDIRHIATLGKRPEHSVTVKFLASIPGAFAPDVINYPEDGTFQIPRIFSLTENYQESFLFLKNLFFVLYRHKCETISLDYKNCQRIDVDASVCMDIMLAEFISHIKACRRSGHNAHVNTIVPLNYQAPYILKILFSIGAFRNLRGFRVEFPDIISYPLCLGNKNNPDYPEQREVDITNMVDYIMKCLKRMNRVLTAQAEDNLYKVIGEIIINAEEHSSTQYRYSIGYFQQTNSDQDKVGIFNLVIFNFGQTIYELFKDPLCPNQKVVKQMKDLSEEFTKRSLFSKAEFEEQTLWTLYALQEGVTSKKDWKRGNGSIRFIESFFHLKGDTEIDNISKLTIVSGNTRITFDGTYGIIEKQKGKDNRKYKMMTFNSSGDISEKPDKNFVTFVDNYFPGTMISARICIKYNNTDSQTNEFNIAN